MSGEKIKFEAELTEQSTDLDAAGAFDGRNQRLLITNLLRRDGGDDDIDLLYGFD